MTTPIVQGEILENLGETKRKISPRSLANLKPAKKGEPSRNPGGRPKSARISEAYRQILESEGAQALAMRIYQDAVKGKRASDRLGAAKEITDRTEGKAIQAIRVTGEVDPNTMAKLTELADLLRQ